MKKIKPPLGSIKILSEEFKVTRATVDMALAFYNNSDTAKAIRTRAVEMMKTALDEANEIIELIKE